MEPTQEQIDAIKTKHPNNRLCQIIVQDAAGEDVYVIALVPDRAIWKKFQSDALDEKRKLHALDNLLKTCVKHPDQKSLDAVINDLPGVINTIGNKLLEHAGVSVEAESKLL